MSEPLSFEGPEAPAQPTDRLFFALVPDAAAASRIWALAQQLRGQHGLKGKPQAAERLHITLVYLGDFDGLRHDVVAQAGQAAAALPMAPFEVRLDRAMSFRRARNRPFVLHSNDEMAPLMSFQQSLVGALRWAGLVLSQREDAQFKPHVTLLYDDRSVADEAIEPVGWTARDFVLVHSLIGQTRHVALGRWPL
ncbi:MAG: 2'-5' RNA ligase family protein [Burkholderiales bacterium]|nr:2'-5' RNA ligase family protein [Burkholderiales bacterium]